MWRALLALVGLAGCADVVGLDDFTISGGGGSGGAVGVEGGAGSAGDPGGGGAGEVGGEGGAGGGALLPCELGWTFTPDPPPANQAVTVSYTDTIGWVYIDLESSPPSQIINGTISGSGPFVWSWTVVAAAGTYLFTFTRQRSEDGATIVHSRCTKTVVP